MDVSLQQLYSFEAEFEPRFIELLQEASERRNIFAEFCDEEKKTPFIESSLRDMTPTGRIHLTGDGAEIYDSWSGLLINRVCTSRGQNSKEQADLVGWVRVTAIRVAMGELQMPYHRIFDIKNAATPRGFDPDTGLDFSEVQHSITIEIHPKVWT